MPDVFDAATRSRMMAGIRSKDTKPEMLLRRGLHARGLRYLLHDRRLPGRPDMVFPARRAVLFAHGCFWHGHDCPLFRLPLTRPEFWAAKIQKNQEIDARSTAALADAFWRVGIVWECALKGRGRLPLDPLLDACAGWVAGDEPILEIRGVFAQPCCLGGPYDSGV
ncbi:DNA mismatch endonuclease Vsr [Mesorhizobium sp. M0013]|uniref:very short patch repair endonuclease n=1 Tax=Mesorhizobium sp. M0013 TaxID=2956841 RepID=UPI00333E1530